jgi:hypothetical protein
MIGPHELSAHICIYAFLSSSLLLLVLPAYQSSASLSSIHQLINCIMHTPKNPICLLRPDSGHVVSQVQFDERKGASPAEPTNLAPKLEFPGRPPKILGLIFSLDSSRSPQIMPPSQRQRCRGQKAPPTQ